MPARIARPDGRRYLVGARRPSPDMTDIDWVVRELADDEAIPEPPADDCADAVVTDAVPAGDDDVAEEGDDGEAQ